MMLRQKILEALKPLVGLPLTATRRAADMRTLQFGKLVEVERGSVGDFALHIQCTWRIEGPTGIVTGRLDLYEPLEEITGSAWETWNYEKSPNWQDKLFQEYLNNYQPGPVVQTVDADEFGGAVVEFENGYKLRMFPAGSISEDWRIFGHGDLDQHFVICGGKLDSPDSE